MLENYNTIAQKRLDRIESTSPSPSSAPRSRRNSKDTEAERQKVHLEKDLWALAHDMLLSSSPQSRNEVEVIQRNVLEHLHRYSTNAEIWSAFLDSDLSAQECEAVLSWLQDRAKFWSPSIEEITAPTLAKAERGDGVWSSTFFYTKNAIKSQKRSRSLPQPLEPSNPGIRSSHQRRDGKPLVTQLDPDARTRETATLQPQDEYHEQASWQACWELIRRGRPQNNFQKYWDQRKEVWRFAVLRANDAFMVRGKEMDKSPWLRIMNIATNPEWFNCCQELCQLDERNYDFQSAVYGILCGDVKASMKVCRTTDDHLFALFNSLLVARFTGFVDAYEEKLSDSSKISYSPTLASLEPVRKYLVSSQMDETLKEPSHNVLECIEGALVSKDFNAFFVQLGHAAAQVAHASGDGPHLINADSGAPQTKVAQMAAQDPDSVRMIAHLQLLYKTLGYLKKAYDTQLYTVENNIVSYIGWLQREGKFNLVPLYASKLSPDRIPYVLGTILIDLHDPKERDFQVRLIKQYQINVSDVLWGMFSLANSVDVGKFKRGGIQMTAPRVTELVGGGKIKNVKIRTGFIGTEIEAQDEVALRSAEWFRYVDAENWGKACYSVSTLYKIFLFQGKLLAARELADRASLTDVSLASLGLNAHLADVVSPMEETTDIDMDDTSQDGQTQPISPSKKRKDHPLVRPGTTREIAASQALVWGQLEQLTVALEAFDRWSELADEIDG